MPTDLLDATIDDLRKREFPAVENGIFLAASGGTPLCRSARDAAVSVIDEMGRIGDTNFPRYIYGMNEARIHIADYLGASSNEIAFLPNSSSSAAIMVAMLKRCGVTRVFYPAGEFPTSTHALKNSGLQTIPLGRRELDDTPADWLNALSEALEAQPDTEDGATALVASHVNFLSGARVDLEAFAAFSAAHRIRLVINATQSFGALPMDVEGIDLLFGTGLKWAAAGFGTGFLYLRQSLVDEVGLPSHTGWLSIEDPGRMDNTRYAPIQCAKSLDMGGGAPPFQTILALGGALEMMTRVGDGDIREGIRRIETRILKLAAYFKTRLDALGLPFIGQVSPHPESGAVSIVHPEAPRLHAALADQKIFTSLRHHPISGEQSVIRFGINFFIKKEELDQATALLETLV